MQKSRNDGPRTWRDSLAISALFVLLGFLYFCYVVFSSSPFLFKKFNPVQAEKTYSQSQWQQSQNISEDKVLDEWAIKNGNTGWKNYVDENKSKINTEAQKQKIIRDIKNKGVSDSFLYGYAGYKYSTGANPSLLNPEHPPLAKYIIGYSIKFFGSEHVFGIVIAFAVLILVAAISYQINASLLLASFAFFLTSTFPLFTDQIQHGPQLELYQLFFFLLVVHMLLNGMKKKKIIFYVCAGIFLGMMFSTKTFLPFFLLLSTWIVLALWKQWKAIITIIGLGILIFTATYYQYFALGGTLRTFLGLQKYIVVFYGNSNIPLFEFFGNCFRLIFTGFWKFWDTARSVSFYEGWNILWPIIFVLGLWRMKHMGGKNPSRIITVFLILYAIFVCIVPVFPRYLLLLYVPMIILL